MPLLPRRSDNPRQAGAGPAAPLPAGKTDLLLRFFDSNFFDEWIALTYLYKSNSPGVQDYLCNRLYALPEAGLEKYLSQLIQLIIIKPYGPLEKVVVDLCAKSLRIAVKTYWLLLAVSQDQPKNKYVAELRDCCERAALEGSWDPPFKRTRLLPLSPPRSRGWLLSSPISPGLLIGAQSGKLRPRPSEQRVTANSSNRFGSPDPFQGGDRPQHQQSGGSQPPMDIMSRPTSPDGLGGGIYSSYTMGAGLEGLICASPPPTRDGGAPRAVTSTQIAKATEAERAEARSLSADRRQKLKLELGEAEGISTLLENSLLGAAAAGPAAEGGQPGVVTTGEGGGGRESPPSSPRLRQTTFGATLDFIEALCDASSRLTSFPPEDREWALKRGLDEINKEIEAASRADVACWFPMGSRDERIVRLAAKEAQLLNSREKAPFMLLVEVLSNDQGSVKEDAKYSAGSTGSPPPHTLPRKATGAKTVPKPYTPEGREQRNGHAVEDDSESSPEALSGSSPKRILDFTGKSSAVSAPEQAHKGHDAEPLAADFEISRSTSIEGISCPVTSSFSQQAPAAPETAVPGSGSRESSSAGEAAPGDSEQTGGGQSSSAAAPDADSGHLRDGRSAEQRDAPSAAANAEQPRQGAQRPGALSAALGHRPRPVNIPADSSSSTEPSPDMLPPHAAIVGSPTTTAPVMASIRRTRSNEDGMQDGTHDLKSLGSGGMRLGPVSLVRAVGRVIRSVVGGDSEDSHQHQQHHLAHQTSADAADAAARVALAAANTGMGAAQQAQEDARAARLRHAMMDDMSRGGALSPRAPHRSGGFLQDGPPSGPESSENSFSRGLQSAMAGLGGTGPPVTVRLEVIGDYTKEELEAAEAASQLSSEPCQHRTSSGESSLTSRISQGGGAKKAESKESVVSGARALTLLCHWGNPKTKEDDIRRRRMHPHVKVRLKVHGGVDLRLVSKPMSVHRRIPSDEALMRMAAHHRAPVPKLPTVTSPPTSPTPSQDLTSIVDAMHEAMRKATEADARRAQQQESMNGVDAPAASAEAGDASGDPAIGSSGQASRTAEEDAEKAAAAARAVYGECFADKAKRVQRLSPHGRRPGWAVRPIIVKSGDDCRQELLAAQLIQAFAHIFSESCLPLYLRPYEVLVTSSRTALIEVVPDSLSIHTIKAKGPVNASLSDHFFAKFRRGSQECKDAQRAFAESMAAYSLVCYFLQIKDRHNGNILMDDVGHIIHIDFGFMLSNSPGGVNFEAAPFKLTRELLEIMDSNSEGHASEVFDYFKVLCIQGFLACRKHADRIILLVDMMSTSGCPCFKAGARCVSALRKRFHLHCTETQCVEVVLNLIADSLDAWRTRQYDYYQRVLNGIL